MRPIIRNILFLILAVSLTSMAAHKYYVAVFQMDYIPAKKEIQVTARIFIDDLEAALQKKYNRKFYLGTSSEAVDSDAVLKQYFSEKIGVKVNGKNQALTFIGKETDDDVLVCYSKITGQKPVKSLQVENSVLMEVYEDQQNIIHAKIGSNKKSLLLTNEKSKGELAF